MPNEIFSGKYHVQREIARGGMGTVYLAVDQTLHREVAIKLPHSQLSCDPKFVRKFLREAQRMAQMNHENVIRIYEIEEDKGVHFIVMEYFPGQDLKQLLLKRGSLEISLALRIAISITQGLVYAHKRDLIHRDIKPGNVLLDDQFNVKIVDFGIAAALGESSTTMTSTLLGTPEYMSPEQVQGIQLTTSSDLYSLGMVLYEMVTGTTPYKGTPYQIILAKLADDSFEPAYHFPAHVPSSLQYLIRGLTNKGSTNRLQDTTVVLETLRSYQHQSDFLSVADTTFGPEEEQLSETVVLGDLPPIHQNVHRDKTKTLEADIEHPPLPQRVSPLPSSRSTVLVQTSLDGGMTSGKEASEISESSSKNLPTIEIGDERQPLATSSWLLLSFAVILVVGMSGYLWFRTSFHAPVSAPPVIEDGSVDSEDMAPTSNVAIEKAKQVIEKLGSLQKNTQILDQKISSHGRNFETAAQQLVEKLQLLGQRMPVGGGSQPSELARSREVLSQNWRVLVTERDSESGQLSKSSKGIETEIKHVSKDVNAMLSVSLPPAMKDTLERKRNELLVVHRNVLSRISRVANQWQAYLARMDELLTLPKPPVSSRAELDGILAQFREAYQRQDLPLLDDITTMSESRFRMIRGLFQYWDSFTVKVGVRLKTPETATVVVTLANMMDRQGKPISKDREKIIGTQHLTIHKQGNKWGKLEW
ncbi:MAG: serine/threonine-protein kinase [Nitrospirales bacterium]